MILDLLFIFFALAVVALVLGFPELLITAYYKILDGNIRKW
jgi:hypothetical protein